MANQDRKKRPIIGIFDSGLGGLSVLSALADIHPETDVMYAADAAHAPYGNKTPEQIRKRVLAMGKALVNKGCTTLVVACNTATAAALESLRVMYPNIPIVGVEPGIKPAAINTQSSKIAVLVTAATAKSNRLEQLISRYAPHKIVYIIPCYGWVTEIESLNLSASSIIQEIKLNLLPLIQQGVDQVVLGCTHYDFLTPILHHLIGDKAQLVGVSEAVARQICKVSGVTKMISGNIGNIHLLATARPEYLKEALPILGLNRLIRYRGYAPQLLVTDT